MYCFMDDNYNWFRVTAKSAVFKFYPSLIIYVYICFYSHFKISPSNTIPAWVGVYASIIIKLNGRIWWSCRMQWDRERLGDSVFNEAGGRVECAIAKPRATSCIRPDHQILGHWVLFLSHTHLFSWTFAQFFGPAVGEILNLTACKWRHSAPYSTPVGYGKPYSTPVEYARMLFNWKCFNACGINIGLESQFIHIIFLDDMSWVRLPVHPTFFGWLYVVGSNPSPANFFRMTLCRGFESQSSQLFSDDVRYVVGSTNPSYSTVADKFIKLCRIRILVCPTFFEWVRISVNPTSFGSIYEFIKTNL